MMQPSVVSCPLNWPVKEATEQAGLEGRNSVLGCLLDTVEEVCKRRMLAKLTSTMKNTSHALRRAEKALRSSFSGRPIHLLSDCTTQQFSCTFSVLTGQNNSSHTYVTITPSISNVNMSIDCVIAKLTFIFQLIFFSLFIELVNYLSVGSIKFYLMLFYLIFS